MTTPDRPTLRFLASFAAIAVLIAACSSAAAPPPVSPPADGPSLTPVPGGSGGTGGGSGGSGGGSGGGVIVRPAPIDPAGGQPTIFTPRPGQMNVHPVAPTTLQASVDGHHVLVKVSWYSGVEPCNVLDSVRVERSGTTIAITVIEGASALDVACIEIAQLKATIVDLGDLEPGTWTISAPNGDATPVDVTIA